MVGESIFSNTGMPVPIAFACSVYAEVKDSYGKKDVLNMSKPRRPRPMIRAAAGKRPLQAKAQVKGIYGGGNLLTPFGGWNGILATMDQIQQLLTMVKRMEPMFRMLNELDNAANVSQQSRIPRR